MFTLIALTALASAQEAEIGLSDPVFEVGPTQFLPDVTVPATALAMETCVSSPDSLTAPPQWPRDGMLSVQLRIRKGKVALVTVNETDPGLQWLTPCLTRELAAVEWSKRRGKAEVPVRILQAE